MTQRDSDCIDAPLRNARPLIGHSKRVPEKSFKKHALIRVIHDGRVDKPTSLAHSVQPFKNFLALPLARDTIRFALTAVLEFWASPGTVAGAFSCADT